MYRFQRYIYDFTRKYYLLGRDRLLAEMEIKPGENVLEIGCGTGRNLIILAKQYPNTHFFGLDASAAMLELAQAKIGKSNLKNITLETALADDFSYNKTFDQSEPFDTIYFSYSISMIPVWRESIQNALANLKSEGELFVLDFYDQSALPVMLREPMRRWLELFSVRYPSELRSFLRELDENGKGIEDFHVLYRTYAFISRFRKVGTDKGVGSAS